MPVKLLFMKKSSIKVNTHISLQLPRLEFAETIFAIIENQKNYLKQWLNWIDRVKSVDSIKTQIREAIALNKGGQQLNTYIFYDHYLVGAVGFINIHKIHQKAEMGYWIRQDFQGKGITSKSCRRLIDYGFQHLQLNRISIKIMTENHKSLTIPKKLGFQSEGTLRQDAFFNNRFYDIEVFSLLLEEWKNKEV